MSPDDLTDSDVVSIDVGNGTSRRDVLKQLSAAGVAMGMAAAAGCQSSTDDTDTPSGGNGNGNDECTPVGTGGNGGNGNGGNGNGNGNGSGSQQSFDFSIHPAVSPPEWDGSKTESGDGNNTRTAVFVYQNSENPFFVPMTVGFNDALNNYGWEGQALARPTGSGGNPTVQTTLIENQITGGSDPGLGAGDVLVTTILNNSSFNDVIQQALDNDIAVINGHTTPNPEDWNKEFMLNEAGGDGFTYKDNPITIPHVGIQDERAGTALGVEAYDRMQEINPDPEGGEYTVVITNGLDINPSVTRRVDAGATNRGTAQRYLESRSDPGVSLYNDEILSVDANATNAESAIESTIQGDEGQIDAVLSAGYWGAVGGGNLINTGILDEDVVTGGFDLDQRMINNIKQGFTDFTVAQDPYSQGYMNVPLAWIWLERGMEMKTIEWGVSIWDESNITFADERRSWADLKTWQENNFDGLTN